jgi:hypothetical protein
MSANFVSEISDFDSTFGDDRRGDDRHAEDRRSRRQQLESQAAKYAFYQPPSSLQKFLILKLDSKVHQKYQDNCNYDNNEQPFWFHGIQNTETFRFS